MNIVSKLWVYDSTTRNYQRKPLEARHSVYASSDRKICMYLKTTYLLEEVEEGYKLHSFNYFIEPEVELPAFASMETECLDFDKNFECIGGREAFDQFFLLDVKKKSIPIRIIMEIFSVKNPFCYEFIQSRSLFNDIERAERAFFKLFEYACFEPNVLEKLFKSLQVEIVRKHLLSTEPIFEDKSKMHQVIGIPKKALAILNEYGIADGLEGLTVIAKINVDYANMVMNFVKVVLEADYKLNHPKSRKVRTSELKIRNVPFKDYFQNIAFLIAKGYQLNDLLKYTLKQQILYSNMDKATQSITVPFRETRNLVHYINMCEEMNVAYEKYPTILDKAHLVYSKNYKMINDKGLGEAFKEYAVKLKTYEVFNKKYCFIAPEKIEDIAFEGNTLNHCLGSYCKDILKSKKIVLFFRDVDKKDVPFVTVELSCFKGKFSIVEAAGMYNKEPEAEILNEIKLLMKELKEA